MLCFFSQVFLGVFFGFFFTVSGYRIKRVYLLIFCMSVTQQVALK